MLFSGILFLQKDKNKTCGNSADEYKFLKNIGKSHYCRKKKQD